MTLISVFLLSVLSGPILREELLVVVGFNTRFSLIVARFHLLVQEPRLVFEQQAVDA